MRKVKKIISTLVASTLIISCVPSVNGISEYEARKMGIQMGANGLKSGCKIYLGETTNKINDTYSFGNNKENVPIQWRVVDSESTNNGNANGMLLMTEELLGSGAYGGIQFNRNNFSSDWKESSVKVWCENFYANNLAKGEQNAVLSTSKIDDEYKYNANVDTKYKYSYEHTFPRIQALDNDKVFFLSAEEICKYYPNYKDRVAMYNGEAGFYWLRSPYQYTWYNNANVDEDGKVGIGYTDHYWAVRPAINVDKSEILFIFPAENGKNADDEFVTNEQYTGNEYKLTLLDENRQLTVNSATVNEKDVHIEYSDATVSENSYISMVIVDKFGVVSNYGRIKALSDANSTSGTIDLHLQNRVKTSDSVYVFNEEYNGDFHTDYAGNLIEIKNLKEISTPDEATPDEAATEETNPTETTPSETVQETTSPVDELPDDGYYVEINNTRYKLRPLSKNTFYKPVALKAGTYQFKMNNHGELLGYGATVYDQTAKSLSFKSKYNAYCNLVATGGAYTFQFDADTNKLIIKYVNLPKIVEDYYLYGTINGQIYDNINKNEFKFDNNGDLTVKFSEDSSIGLMCPQNNKSFEMAESNLVVDNKAELLCKNDNTTVNTKLLNLPAGSYKLKIDYNKNGSINFEYVSIEPKE